MTPARGRGRAAQAYPYRFTTADRLEGAGWPDCGCGHRAVLHGLLAQHVGGSGCFKTFWRPGVLSALVFAGGCDCETYRPIHGIPADRLALATITPGVGDPAGAEVLPADVTPSARPARVAFGPATQPPAREELPLVVGTRVVYHGSIQSAHGPGRIASDDCGCDGCCERNAWKERFEVRLDTGVYLLHVRRSSLSPESDR